MFAGPPPFGQAFPRFRTPVMNPFLLRRSDSNTRSDASAASGDHAGKQSPAPRILVVDDERVIADTIVRILNKNGFIAEAAYGGEKAIEKTPPHSRAPKPPPSPSAESPPPSKSSPVHASAATPSSSSPSPSTPPSSSSTSAKTDQALGGPSFHAVKGWGVAR